MATGRKLAIIGSALVVLSAGGYLIYEYLIKPKKQAKGKSIDTTLPDNTGVLNPSPSAPNPVPNDNQSKPLLPFTSSAEIKAFQDWMDINYPTWLNNGRLSKGAGYGNYGSNTSNAYEIHKQEYCDITGICPLGLVRSKTSTQAPSTKILSWEGLKTFFNNWYFKDLNNFNNGKLQLSTKSYNNTIPTRTLIDFYPSGYGEFMAFDSKNGTQNKIPFNWYFSTSDLILECKGKTFVVPTYNAITNGYNGVWDMIKASGFNFFSGIDANKPLNPEMNGTRIFDGTEGQPRKFKLG